MDTGASLPALERGSAEWGDYDKDNDLDIVITGVDSMSIRKSEIYRNDLGTFVSVGAPLTGVEQSAVAWADFDRDGDLDLVLSGLDGSSVPVTRLYRNDAGSFVGMATGLPGVRQGTVSWGDVDNDGDLDLVLAGLDASSQPITRLYRNSGGVFSDSGMILDQVYRAAAAWADYDLDGDVDLYVTGRTMGGTALRTLYKNDAGTLSIQGSNTTDLYDAAVAWMDMSGDGYPDLAVSGSNNGNSVTLVYVNSSGSGNFTVAGTPSSPSLTSPGLSWGDYDADGDPDLLLCGSNNLSQPVTVLYRNDGVFSFVPVAAGLEDIREGTVRFGDYDKDGRLDVYLSGRGGSGLVSHLYHNVEPGANTIPAAPSGLSAVINGNQATFSWNAGSDAQTPANSLTYNLRMGSTPVGNDIVPGMADSLTGYRQVVQTGNVGHVLNWSIPLTNLAPTTYWSVQAIDASFSGSTMTTAQFVWAQTQTALTSSPNPSGPGQSVTLTATVTPSTATGTVTFKDGATTLGTNTLSGGVATRVTSSLSAGSHSLTATYNGNGTNTASTSPGHVHVVLTPTTTGLISSLNPSTAGQSVTFTATVSPASATGTVTFTDGGSPIGSGTLSGGTATLATAALSVGSHTIRANYNGDGNYLASTSSNLIQSVLQTTTTQLVSNPNPSNPGQNVILTATVTPPSATGTVTFKDGTNTIGTATLSGGVATRNTSSLSQGVHSLTAVYQGSGTHAGSTSAAVSHTVKLGTTTTLSTTPNPSLDGQNVLMTATVFPNTATGLVTFKDGAATIGTAPLISGGASLNTSSLAVGVHPLTATYGGDSTYASSVSAGVNHTVNGPFTDIGAGLTGVNLSSVAWGDYDNDGDLDILLTGFDHMDQVSRIYRNSGGLNPTFTDIAAGLPGVANSSAAWGDYDNDGDLDVLLSGHTESNDMSPISRIYRNSGGPNPTFSDVASGLPGMGEASVAWGDYDNDGDLDFLLTGWSGTDLFSLVYRNNGGPNPAFTDIGAGLPGIANGSVAWGDYDKDGDLDILLVGASTVGTISRIYRNDGGSNPTFADVSAGMTGLTVASAGWGDYDNDGDLDVLLAGATTSDETNPTTLIYRNNGGPNPSFTEIGAGLPGVREPSAAWGDYDNDGDLDILLTGDTESEIISRVYRNNGGPNPTFSDIGAGLTGVYLSSTAWGDYDNDGDLDILLTGWTGSAMISRIYRNNASTANTIPTAPTGLSAQLAGNAATFTWNASTDSETPSPGLTYNLRVGTTPGGNEISSCMANTAGGYRRVPRIGNTNHRLSWSLDLPPAAQYYWSVQAVDNSFAGSPFAAEEVITPCQSSSILFHDDLDGTPGTDLVGTVPNFGGNAYVGYHIQPTGQILFATGGGVQDVGPNSRSTATVSQSTLITPYAISSLAAGDILHFQVTMANISATPLSNVFESSRVDLVTGTGLITLGELSFPSQPAQSNNGNWGANSDVGSPITSNLTTRQAGLFLLDLYLDPNNAMGGGAINGYLSVNGSPLVSGTIAGLTGSTTINAIQLVRNVDDEVYFRGLTLERLQACAFVGPPPCTPPPANMTAWWPLDEISNSIAVDIQGSSIATYVGSPGHVAGKVGTAVRLSNSGQYVEAASNASLNFGTGDFSIDAWIRTSDASGLVRTIVDKRSSSSPAGYSLYLYNGRLGFQLADAGGWTNTNSSFPVITDGAWHHIAMSVVRSGNCTLYVDGAPVLVFDATVQPGSVTNPGSLRIGQAFHGGSASINGDIDEVELFNRALTASEVLNIYSAGSSGKCRLTSGVDSSFDHPPTPSFLRILNNPLLTGNAQIRFRMTEPDDVEIRIFSVAGRLEKTFALGRLDAGEQDVTWDGTIEEGRAARGIYFIQVSLKAAGIRESQRIVILK